MFEVKLKRGLGAAFLNLVRSSAYYSVPALRPIGFKVGAESNVVDISDCVLEDMVTFISTVSCVDYSYAGEKNVVEVHCVCDGELMLSQLLAGSGISANKDAAVLHSTAPTDVSVVFRKTIGCALVEGNTAILEDEGYRGYVAVNSRHCCVTRFNFYKVNETDECDIFSVSIELSEACALTESDIYRLALRGIVEIISTVSRNEAAIT